MIFCHVLRRAINCAVISVGFRIRSQVVDICCRLSVAISNSEQLDIALCQRLQK